MNLDDINNIDPNNYGNWPIPIKVVVIIIICILSLFAGYWLVSKDQLTQLETLQQQEQTLKKDFESKQRLANSLPALKKQLTQIEESFSELLKQLPKKKEIPALVVDISQTGLANGLSFELFEPKGERAGGEEGFYNELPIKLSLTGDYHSLGRFVSGLARLPRIVTQHDITITPISNSNKLTMKMTAKTYRYKDEEEKEEKE
jgi:type IV pilus assembly protein PilO